MTRTMCLDRTADVFAAPFGGLCSAPETAFGTRPSGREPTTERVVVMEFASAASRLIRG